MDDASLELVESGGEAHVLVASVSAALVALNASDRMTTR